MMIPQDYLRQLILSRSWPSLTTALDKMSNMQFRLTVKFLREQLLPTIDDCDLFWEALAHIILYKSKAMITCIVAAKGLAQSGRLRFDTEGCRRIKDHLAAHQPEALTKIAMMTVPLLVTEEQIETMLDAFGINTAEQRIAILLTTGSPLAYFTIFKTLKMSEDAELTRRCCTSLIKRKEDMAFNAACIFKEYFGLEDLSAQFSLKIEHYELSHIDRDYSTFLRMLNGKRPTI